MIKLCVMLLMRRLNCNYNPKSSLKLKDKDEKERQTFPKSSEGRKRIVME